MNMEAAKNVVSNGSSMLLYGAIIALGGRIIWDWLKGSRISKEREAIAHISLTCNWLREEHHRVADGHKAMADTLGEIRDSLNRLVTLQEKK